MNKISANDNRPAHPAILQQQDLPATLAILLLLATLTAATTIGIIYQNEKVVDADTAARQHATFQVDINHAAWPELSALPQIGPKLSKAIVAYREQHGPFTSLDQLQQVRGIGEGKFEKIRGMILPLGQDQTR